MNLKATFFTYILLSASLAMALGQLPGGVRVTTSKLDGERQIQVERGWLKGDDLFGTLKLGGFWTDKSPTNFMLEAVLVGGGAPQRLKVGIDGRVSEFTRTGVAPGTRYNQLRQANGSRCLWHLCNRW